MKALITGASSGIGLSFSKYLNDLGYDLVLVTRKKDKLEDLVKDYKVNVKIEELDIKNINDLEKLFSNNKDIDMLINCAGFGLFGEFINTDLDRELEMIDVNIKTLHVLTKLYVKEMVKNNRGYILNVASMAGFSSGPLMSTYYATKNYVIALSEALNFELKKKNKNVIASCLCPGPVNTNFNRVAGVKFNDRGINSDYVAKYGIDNLLKGKTIIIPTLKFKMAAFFRRFAPRKLILNIIYNYQHKKNNS